MPRATQMLLLMLMVVTAPVLAADDKSKPPPLGTASFTPPEGNTKLHPLTPETFVTRVAVANMAEIELSQLALDKSADTSVRQFATQLVKDHEAAQAKLKSVAASAKIALPGTVDEDHRKQKEQLAELAGVDFDKRYLALMHSGHQQALGLLNDAAQSQALDTSLRNYAGEMTKVVQRHAKTLEGMHAH